MNAVREHWESQHQAGVPGSCNGSLIGHQTLPESPSMAEFAEKIHSNSFVLCHRKYFCFIWPKILLEEAEFVGWDDLWVFSVRYLTLWDICRQDLENRNFYTTLNWIKSSSTYLQWWIRNTPAKTHQVQDFLVEETVSHGRILLASLKRISSAIYFGVRTRCSEKETGQGLVSYQ